MMLSSRSSTIASTLSRHGKLWLGGIRTLKSPAYRRMMAKQKSGVVPAKPTLHEAEAMPMGMREFSNESLVSLAAMKNHKARIEVLKRHIMIVDQVSYDTACERFEQIQKSNQNGMWLASLPYLTGIACASSAAAASIPLCFYLPVVGEFNEKYVTTGTSTAKCCVTCPWCTLIFLVPACCRCSRGC